MTGDHDVYVNRGVAGSQAYIHRFGDRAPDKVPNRKAFETERLPGWCQERGASPSAFSPALLCPGQEGGVFTRPPALNEPIESWHEGEFPMVFLLNRQPGRRGSTPGARSRRFLTRVRGSAV